MTIASDFVVIQADHEDLWSEHPSFEQSFTCGESNNIASGSESAYLEFTIDSASNTDEIGDIVVSLYGAKEDYIEIGRVRTILRTFEISVDRRAYQQRRYDYRSRIVIPFDGGLLNPFMGEFRNIPLPVDIPGHPDPSGFPIDVEFGINRLKMEITAGWALVSNIICHFRQRI